MANKLFEGSEHAELYKSYRSPMPEHLAVKSLEYFREKIQGPLLHIVDVGCGSGQSSEYFASNFTKYTGIDTSEAQILQATQANKFPNAEFRVGNAEKLPFEDNSITAINVHLALHWFDIPKFFQEVNRILVPNGAVSISAYLLMQPSTEKGDSERMNALLYRFWEEILAPYHHPSLINFFNFYDPEKTEYPFSDLIKLTLPTTRNFSLKIAFGYLRSWSSFQNFKREQPEKAEADFNEWKSEFMIAAGAETEEENISLLYSDMFLILGRKKSEA